MNQEYNQSDIFFNFQPQNITFEKQKTMENGESEMYYERAVRIDEVNDIFTLKRNGNHFKSSQAYKIGQSQYA